MSSRSLLQKPMVTAMSALAALLAALGLGACGSGSSSGVGAPGTKVATVVESSAPDSLDPQVGATTTSAEATWNAYLGLYTYAHANGTAGTAVIPALAKALPQISDGGRRYATTLRRGLRFSNGELVEAEDFRFAIERAIKLNWGDKSFFTEHIAGAEAFDEGKAKTISGISVDDRTGRIAIELTAPYGAFLNVLAFPAAGLVPARTPMKALPTDPPPGVGPYEIENVIPGKSFEERIDPRWAAEAIPGIPTPKLDVEVRVQSNGSAEAEEVLDDEADLFDWNTPLPPAAIAQAKSTAASRYAVEPVAQVSYFFLNVDEAPFSSLKAREAVEVALDRPAFARLASGYLEPGCYLLPPGLVGHPSSRCPYGSPTSTGNVGRARKLLVESGMAGKEVTVWGFAASPAREFVDSFTQTLDAIGLKASEKVISPSTYFPTITDLRTKAQAGFSEYTEDFPNPVDFYQLIDGAFIEPEGNHDLSLARDRVIDEGVARLEKVPASKLPLLAGQWEALERRTAKQAYMAVVGYEEAPKLTASNVDFDALVFSPVYGPDWMTLRLG